MAHIEIYDDEPLEKALKRFKRKVEKEGIIREFKKRQYYQKPSAKRHEQEKSRQRKELKKLRKLDRRKLY